MDVPLTVMIAVLLAAVLHAGWNALLKASPDKVLGNIGQAIARGAIALVVAPFLPVPAPESWPWIVASVVVHIAYFRLLAGAYRWGDLSFTYPIMRGGAPAIVAVVGVFLFAEVLPWAETMALALICAGILAFASARHGAQVAQVAQAAQRRALAFALANAAVIACYTLIDARGVRLSGAPVSYALWFFVGNSVVQVSLGLGERRREVLPYLVRHWRQASVGGVFMIGAYGTALWAMTQAPVALVAALRETSVIFAALLGALFLGEKMTRRKVFGTALVVAGLIALRL